MTMTPNATTSTPATISTVPDDYLELIHRFPLRVIRDDTEYDAAVAVLYELDVKVELGGERTASERQYAEVLVLLIGAYDDEHYSFPNSDLSLPERLRGTMELFDLNQSQIAEIAGISRGNMSDVMAGRREFSKESIKRLVERFKVSADYFM